MSELINRISNHKEYLSIVNSPRGQKIIKHYEQRIAAGMKLSYAVDQALANLSGSNRHDAIRGERLESEAGYDNA